MNHISGKKTTIINIFGGPGIGKSTAAALLFAHMRMKGISCEYVPEFAKELSRAGDMESIENQFFISAVQYHRQYRLIGKVDFIVTDSPVLLGVVYDQQLLKGFNEIMRDIHGKSLSINILLTRDKSRDYENEGRHHNSTEADVFDKKIERMLDEYEVTYCKVNASEMHHLPDYIMHILEVV